MQHIDWMMNDRPEAGLESGSQSVNGCARHFWKKVEHLGQGPQEDIQIYGNL